MPRTSQHLDLSFGRMHVSRGGEGPPLVLIHGYLVSHEYFDPVRDTLEKHFQVYAFDLPGHGESASPDPARFAYDMASMADAVAEDMDALGLSRAHVYGHSMGGLVSAVFAARHPARVDRLLLEGAAYYRPPIPLDARVALLPLVGRFVFVKVFGRRDIRKQFARAYRDPALLKEEFVDFYWERFNRPGVRVAAHALLRTLAARPDEPPEAAKIQAPTLVVWGDSDVICPVAWAQRMVASIRGARLEMIAQCGHSPHEEKPEAFLRVALPFLEGSAQSAALG